MTASTSGELNKPSLLRSFGRPARESGLTGMPTQEVIARSAKTYAGTSDLASEAGAQKFSASMRPEVVGA